MPAAPHEQRQHVRDALDGVQHAIPRDLARDVLYYVDDARDPELAIDVLVDGIIDGRMLLGLEEFERLRAALEACGRVADRRLLWLEEHGMRPIPAGEDED